MSGDTALRDATLAHFATPREVGQRRTAGPVAARLESAAARLTSDALTILVCGEFKRGKSTLLNALLDEQEAQELTFNVTWN